MRLAVVAFLGVLSLSGCHSPPRPSQLAPRPDTRTYQNVEAGIHINTGMGKDQVVRLIGSQPFTRDVRGVNEALQWCRTIPGNNDKYLIVYFVNGLVVGVNTRSWSAKYDCIDTPAVINWEQKAGEVKELRIR